MRICRDSDNEALAKVPVAVTESTRGHHETVVKEVMIPHPWYEGLRDRTKGLSRDVIVEEALVQVGQLAA